MLIIYERVAAGTADSRTAFEAANPDLFEWRNGALLASYYDAETLASDHARRAFVPPERIGAQSAGACA